MSMYIRIKATDQIWKPGIKMAKGNAQQERLLGEFAHFIADIYRDKIVEAINSQKYKGNWEPLSPRYKAWKIRNGLFPGIWMSTGLLRDSIQVYRSNNAWVVGVKPGIYYPGTKTSVYKVCRYLEFGTSKMKARPLFRPVKLVISKNIRRYWEIFLMKKGIIP